MKGICTTHNHSGAFHLPCPFDECAKGGHIDVVSVATGRVAANLVGIEGSMDLPTHSMFGREKQRASCCGQVGWSWIEWGTDGLSPISGRCNEHRWPTVMRKDGSTM
jgi:hypothetical protein